MDVGTAAKNSHRFIDISAISVSLGKESYRPKPISKTERPGWKFDTTL